MQLHYQLVLEDKHELFASVSVCYSNPVDQLATGGHHAQELTHGMPFQWKLVSRGKSLSCCVACGLLALRCTDCAIWHCMAQITATKDAVVQYCNLFKGTGAWGGYVMLYPNNQATKWGGRTRQEMMGESWLAKDA